MQATGSGDQPAPCCERSRLRTPLASLPSSSGQDGASCGPEPRTPSSHCGRTRFRPWSGELKSHEPRGRKTKLRDSGAGPGRRRVSSSGSVDIEGLTRLQGVVGVSRARPERRARRQTRAGHPRTWETDPNLGQPAASSKPPLPGSLPEHPPRRSVPPGRSVFRAKLLSANKC